MTNWGGGCRLKTIYQKFKKQKLNLNHSISSLSSAITVKHHLFMMSNSKRTKKKKRVKRNFSTFCHSFS